MFSTRRNLSVKLVSIVTVLKPLTVLSIVLLFDSMYKSTSGTKVTEVPLPKNMLLFVMLIPLPFTYLLGDCLCVSFCF